MINFEDGEFFKPIEGFESMYEVSNMGKIGSWQGHGTAEINDTLRILTPSPKNGNGALRVFLTYPGDGKVKTRYVHRIVAKHFLPEPADGKNIVIHKDFDYKNNKSNNLKWINRKELFERVKNLCNIPIGEAGEDHPMSKLTGYQIKAIRKKYGKVKMEDYKGKHRQKTHKEIAKEYGVSRATIQLVLQKKVWAQSEYL